MSTPPRPGRYDHLIAAKQKADDLADERRTAEAVAALREIATRLPGQPDTLPHGPRVRKEALAQSPASPEPMVFLAMAIARAAANSRRRATRTGDSVGGSPDLR